MFKAIINKMKERRKAKRINKIVSDPRSRLELMKKGYEKFSAHLTERERHAMKKEIKRLERAVKNFDRELAKY